MANKIAVVTGGAGGIGQAVVTRLAQSGFAVCIVDQNEKAGQDLVELMRQEKYHGEFYQVELKRAAEIKGLFERIYAKFQRIDVLVNLAGGTLHKHPITEFPLSEWREVIDVNLKATFLCCQAVSQHMREAKSGAIINT
ncbi:MAG: SDR family NAD(P)-dependent oxidoreductase, partial [Candidatus Binatia bacterium]